MSPAVGVWIQETNLEISGVRWQRSSLGKANHEQGQAKTSLLWYMDVIHSIPGQIYTYFPDRREDGGGEWGEAPFHLPAFPLTLRVSPFVPRDLYVWQGEKRSCVIMVFTHYAAHTMIPYRDCSLLRTKKLISCPGKAPDISTADLCRGSGTPHT